MKFATLGHLMVKENINQMPNEWVYDKWIYSPELKLNETKGHIAGLKLTAKEIMSMPSEKIRKKILDLAIFLQNKLNVELIQLGALTASVTSGAKWLAEQDEYNGFVNHGDSYTAAVTCQAVEKSLEKNGKDSEDLILAIVGSYGIIGEVLSKILVPQFNHSFLIGRRETKLKELRKKIEGSFETSTRIKTDGADVVVTATNHPKALLKSKHLKNKAIVIDVSQPPNLSYSICQKRPDVFRIDGGIVDIPKQFNYHIPGIPKGKIFSCVAEIIMQAMENEKQNHVGSINLKHLKKTEEWGKKYNLTLNELTNFGNPI